MAGWHGGDPLHRSAIPAPAGGEYLEPQTAPAVWLSAVAVTPRPSSSTDPLSLAKLDTKLQWSEALKRAFGIDILRFECGHTAQTASGEAWLKQLNSGEIP